MQIDLPQDLIDRVKQRIVVGEGQTEAEVIRRALDSLDWQDAERRAIQEGIDAMNNGLVRDFDEFDREFRKDNGISADA
jgi:predicted transcriptional regulator